MSPAIVMLARCQPAPAAQSISFIRGGGCKRLHSESSQEDGLSRRSSSDQLPPPPPGILPASARYLPDKNSPPPIQSGVSPSEAFLPENLPNLS